MLLPLISTALLFGGAFILLTQAMLLSVRAVVAAAERGGRNR